MASVACYGLLIKLSNSTQGNKIHNCSTRTPGVFPPVWTCVSDSVVWPGCYCCCCHCCCSYLVSIEAHSLGENKTMTLCTVMAKTFVSGGLCRDWSVVYPKQRVCAVRNTTAVFRCLFTYPAGYTVKEVKWAHGESDEMFYGPFIFDSKIHSSSTKYQYIGNKTSNCSLKIHQVEQADAGRYAFRFITDPTQQYTGTNGPVLHVTGKFCPTSLITVKS